MKPDYCTQKRGRCNQCSLSSYGLDCHSNAIASTPSTPHLRGRKAALAIYTGHTGPVTLAAVEAGCPPELAKRLTGREYGMVLNAINAAYWRGRSALGGVDLCDDCLWLPWGGGPSDSDPTKERGQLVPIAALRAIAIDGRHYTLDYTE